jgi:hypothetical protein
VRGKRGGGRGEGGEAMDWNQDKREAPEVRRELPPYTPHPKP